MIVVKYVTGYEKRVHPERFLRDCDKRVQPSLFGVDIRRSKTETGNKGDKFRKRSIELDLIFKFRGSENEISDNMNDFFEACEADVIEMTRASSF